MVFDCRSPVVYVGCVLNVRRVGSGGGGGAEGDGREGDGEDWNCDWSLSGGGFRREDRRAL